MNNDVVNSYHVYMLLCSDSTYYVGFTGNLEVRLAQHKMGYFPTCYTYERRPLKLVWAQEYDDVFQAIAAEKKIKPWSRAKKKALAEGRSDEIKRLARGPNKKR